MGSEWPRDDSSTLGGAPPKAHAAEHEQPKKPEPNVATVVARVAFQGLDEDMGEGIGELTRAILLRAFKHNEPFRRMMRPLLMLPGLAALREGAGDGASVEAGNELNIEAVGAAALACIMPDVDPISVSQFVRYFETVSLDSMRKISPRRRRSPPKRSVSTEHFVRKRIDPNAEASSLWALPTAKGIEPMGYTSPRATHHHHLAKSPSAPTIMRSRVPPPGVLAPPSPTPVRSPPPKRLSADRVQRCDAAHGGGVTAGGAAAAAGGAPPRGVQPRAVAGAANDAEHHAARVATRAVVPLPAILQADKARGAAVAQGSPGSKWR